MDTNDLIIYWAKNTLTFGWATNQNLLCYTNPSGDFVHITNGLWWFDDAYFSAARDGVYTNTALHKSRTVLTGSTLILNWISNVYWTNSGFFTNDATGQNNYFDGTNWLMSGGYGYGALTGVYTNPSLIGTYTNSGSSFPVWWETWTVGDRGMAWSDWTNTTFQGFTAPFDLHSFVIASNTHTAAIINTVTYAPLTNSPLVNAGTNLTSWGIVNDFYGNPRPTNGMWTIGAVQTTGAAQTNGVVTIIDGGGSGTYNFGATVNVTTNGVHGNYTGSSGYIVTNAPVFSFPMPSNSLVTIVMNYTNPVTYFTLTVNGGTGGGTYPSNTSVTINTNAAGFIGWRGDSGALPQATNVTPQTFNLTNNQTFTAGYFTNAIPTTNQVFYGLYFLAPTNGH